MAEVREAAMLLGILAGASMLSGCADTESVTQSDLDAISDKCGLVRSALQLRAKDEVQFQPPIDSKYEAVDCALAEIKRAIPGMKMGFVGNEEYKAEPKNAQAD